MELQPPKVLLTISLGTPSRLVALMKIYLRDFALTLKIQQVSKASNLVGPKDEDYLIHDEIESTSVVWSPCGEAGALNINSQINLKSSVSGASGLMTTDSEDGKFTYVLGMQWAQCP